MARNGRGTGNHDPKVAILVENQFEDMELWYPYHRLREAGLETVLVGPEVGTYRGKQGQAPAETQYAADEVAASDYAAVVIPGGYAPDHLRQNQAVLDFVKDAHAAGTPVAAICHAGWVLVSAGVATGKTLTSYPSIRDDLVNAGAEWVDREVVVDGNLITSRDPGDLPAFVAAILEAVGEGEHA